MNTLSYVKVRHLSRGVDFEAFAWKQEDGSYSVTWTEGGLRLHARFRSDGVQLEQNKYKLLLSKS